jgi:DNA-binding NarL/FixJ family response regulator
MTDAVPVLVADDHPPTRAGVRLALEEHGFVVCAECSDASSAVAAAERHRPALCLLDIGMPGNGIQAAAQIASRIPETAVVMLTVSRDDDDLFEALRAGASGYLLKDTAPARLAAALRGVLAGEAVLSPALVGRVIDELRGGGRRSRRLRLNKRRGVELTEREWEVLELLRAGQSTAQIAARLSISEVTVRRHVGRTLKALRVPDRQAAVRLLDET